MPALPSSRYIHALLFHGLIEERLINQTYERENKRDKKSGIINVKIVLKEFIILLIILRHVRSQVCQPVILTPYDHLRYSPGCLTYEVVIRCQ